MKDSQYDHLAPYVCCRITAHPTSDFYLLPKGDQGGVGVRLFFRPMVSWSLDPLDGGPFQGVLFPSCPGRAETDTFSRDRLQS